MKDKVEVYTAKKVNNVMQIIKPNDRQLAVTLGASTALQFLMYGILYRGRNSNYSDENMAKQCGLSLKTAQENRRKLQKAGLIHKTRSRYQDTGRYVSHWFIGSEAVAEHKKDSGSRNTGKVAHIFDMNEASA